MLQPLVVICGTTGVGKSNLAIELALQVAKSSTGQWNRAHIVNADAMQVYRGMDIITNKVSDSERQDIPHHLMGFKNPGDQYVVGQWVKDAMDVIQHSHQNREIPIVVGGTAYWIQHLLFPDRLQPESSTPGFDQSLRDSLASLPPELLNLFNQLPAEPPIASQDPDGAFALHGLLDALDPSVAARWHWRDTRKVLRSLQILKHSGRTASDIISQQSQQFDVRPRYRTLCFWLYARPQELHERINTRVDDMLKRGLLKEVKELVDIVQSSHQSNEDDYTLGIFQSIGYREFHKYISLASPTTHDLAAATERMKISTRQYAKRQISWIRNKLLPALYAANKDGKLTDCYLLDATDLSEWSQSVHQQAVAILEDFLEQKECVDPLSLSDPAREMLQIKFKPTDPLDVLQARRKVRCPICSVNPGQPVMLEAGEQWETHQKSRVHRKLMQKGQKSTNLVFR